MPENEDDASMHDADDAGKGDVVDEDLNPDYCNDASEDEAGEENHATQNDREADKDAMTSDGEEALVLEVDSAAGEGVITTKNKALMPEVDSVAATRNANAQEAATTNRLDSCGGPRKMLRLETPGGNTTPTGASSKESTNEPTGASSKVLNGV